MKRGDDGDDDNGERLLTKIEVVVMTGIARDEALRGDALAGALASSEKKIECERIRERERGLVGNRQESRDTRKRTGARKIIQNGAGYHNIGIAAVLKIMIISKKSGNHVSFKLTHLGT